MRQFGLIGKPLSHSFSKKYFSDKFLKEGIREVDYELFPLNHISQLPELLNDQKNIEGLNVTTPYKELVIDLIDEIDPMAEELGAVNTLTIKTTATQGHSLKGYNTDLIGFQKSIKPFLAIQHSRALIFGTGGSSKAVAYVLKQLNIPYFKVSRLPSHADEISYADLSEKVIQEYRLLINCTPLGMFPNIQNSPNIPFQGIAGNHLVYDLIYNPEETLLLKEARKRGAITLNGLSMLKLQAEASWEIWNKKD